MTAAQDWRTDSSFSWPDKIPWSVIGPDFTTVWGRADPADPQPEDVEIVGPKGSGKTRLEIQMLHDRATARDTPAVMVMTKPDDGTVTKLGWPVVDDWRGVTENRQVIYWPRTGLIGRPRRAYHERKIGDLLDRLWQPEANTIIAFDEVGYVESLSTDIRATVQMYWREARSQGITLLAMKQRPQGALRDMHSESMWTASFKPKDRPDLERFAELFGSKRDWMPVFDSLDMMNHEFILRHSKTGQSVISWIDQPMATAQKRRIRKRPAESLGLRRAARPVAR